MYYTYGDANALPHLPHTNFNVHDNANSYAYSHPDAQMHR